jgi:glycosyltransferase involved in cell wall biosynthesis
VKTEAMQRTLNLSNALVIPNGVDLNRFRPLDKESCRKELNLDNNERIILFIAGRNRPEKRLILATEASRLVNENNLRFIHLYDTPNEQVPLYINSADVLLLTSSREGSVNVVKEAMACNCPVVSTDVGDVKLVFGDLEGCFLTSSDPEDIATGIKKALNFGKRTSGRKRLIELGLDADSVAGQLIALYRQVMNQKKDENTGQ